MVSAGAPLLVLPQAIGWYGKLPSRGDFLGRGLPRPWVRVWDEWLQRAMAGAARQVDAALLRERLLAMSPWHVVVLPAAANQPLWSGTVVATTDRVGRVFPMLLAEAYAEAGIDCADLAGLHERAARIGQWLGASATALSPRDFELGVAQWAAQAWSATVPVAGAAEPESIAGLRRSRPAARSFWWRLDATMHEVGVLDEPWPPRESLLLEWLAVSD
jgi:type VI secretion system protein ImpM